jgi:putative protease
MEGKETPKILSPINSYEGAQRVIKAGADELYCEAVIPEFERFFGRPYLGGPIRGPLCSIPTYDELGNVVKEAHANDVEVLLTVNYPFMTKSMEKVMERHIRSCLDEGVDAIILENPGILSIVKKINKHLPLYASMYNVSLNYETCNFLKKVGFSRAILECHLTIPEISEIVKKSDIDIEIFIHGAGCSNLQRTCTLLHYRFPEMNEALSSNDSFFKQPCQLLFDIYDFNKNHLFQKNTRILDAQTSCSICMVPDLIDTGVVGFKITGRCAGIAYQETVTKIYRDLIDLIRAGRIDEYKEKIYVYKREFQPFPGIPANLEEIYCEQMRCQYPPLFHAVYKEPLSWHSWTKSKFKFMRFEK